MNEQPTYCFKWINVDLDGYLEQMRWRADNLRRKANTLNAQAEMIDEEREKLSTALLPVPSDIPNLNE